MWPGTRELAFVRDANAKTYDRGDANVLLLSALATALRTDVKTDGLVGRSTELCRELLLPSLRPLS